MESQTNLTAKDIEIKQARKDLEEMLGARVFLELYVKVIKK